MSQDPNAPPPFDASELPPETSNPWEFMSWVREQTLAKRHDYLQPWVQLVSARPQAERDALVTEGKDAGSTP